MADAYECTEPSEAGPGRSAGARAGSAAGSASQLTSASRRARVPHTCLTQEEIFKARLAALKREEEQLRQEGARLEAEKVEHIR